MTTSHRALRRLAAVVTALTSLAVAALVLAGPAGADTPAAWPSEPPQSPLRTLAILGGIPLAAALVIVLITYLPAIVRGENVRPGASPMSDQWLGGPRKTAGELAAPDTETSQAGGAGGRW